MPRPPNFSLQFLLLFKNFSPVANLCPLFFWFFVCPKPCPCPGPLPLRWVLEKLSFFPPFYPPQFQPLPFLAHTWFPTLTFPQRDFFCTKDTITICVSWFVTGRSNPPPFGLGPLFPPVKFSFLMVAPEIRALMSTFFSFRSLFPEDLPPLAPPPKV